MTDYVSQLEEHNEKLQEEKSLAVKQRDEMEIQFKSMIKGMLTCTNVTKLIIGDLDEWMADVEGCIEDEEECDPFTLEDMLKILKTIRKEITDVQHSSLLYLGRATGVLETEENG